jgi:hypothetical protein
LRGADAMLIVIEKYVTQVRESGKQGNEGGVENTSINFSISFVIISK